MKPEIELVSRETIKPSSPTPSEFKNHHFSFIDQQSPYYYLQFLYFYKNSELLKNSLSQTLTQYYPFAGRLNDRISAVDCDDQGVTFLEANIMNCEMSEMINNVKCCGIPELLFLDDLQGKDQRFNPLLSVQLTRFKCGGGIAIGVYLSHKIGDAATFIKFMNVWSSIARSNSNDHMSPRFDVVGFLQAANDQPSELGSMIRNRDENVTSKSFVFDTSQIMKLKALVGENVKNPSRLEVVAALIYKAAANLESSTMKETNLLQALNLRTRLVPPLPENLIGNIATMFNAASTTTAKEAKEIELWKLVADMKENFRNFCIKYPNEFKTENGPSVFKSYKNEILRLYADRRNRIVYACSSLCRFPVYEVDFGWGKPMWVNAFINLQKNFFVLMDTKDGDGIEASVNLEIKEMPEFERNVEQLLSFYHLKA